MLAQNVPEPVRREAVGLGAGTRMEATMKFAGSIAALVLFIGVPAALAQKTPGMKLSAAECTATWNKLDGAKSNGVTESQAQGTVMNFKAADANNDGKLTETEFKEACDKGMVIAGGTGAGGRGMTGTDTPKK